MDELTKVFCAFGLPGGIAEEFARWRVGDERYTWLQDETGYSYYAPAGSGHLLSTLVELEGEYESKPVYNWTSSDGYECQILTARLGVLCMMYTVVNTSVL